MARVEDKDYYKSVNGRVTVLLRKVPSFRPLTQEQIDEVDNLSLSDRDDVHMITNALIGLLSVQLKELQIIKDKTERKPMLRAVK